VEDPIPRRVRSRPAIGACTRRRDPRHLPHRFNGQAGIEACFEKRVARPLHPPRLQLIVLNQLTTERRSFVHAPQSAVVVLFGEIYPQDNYSQPDTIRRDNAADLLERADFVESVPLPAIDRLGPTRATC